MTPSTANNDPQKIALVLTGGGARGAYQVGVLQGIKEICEAHRMAFPFNIYVGGSAGALNLSFLLSSAKSPFESITELGDIWSNIRTNNIYRSNIGSLSKIGFRWLFDLLSGNLSPKKEARSLLDTDPLKKLLESHFRDDIIQKKIDSKEILGIAIPMFNYSLGISEIVYQTSLPVLPWQSSKQVAKAVQLNSNHILASAAIPILFPPVMINGDAYGDGSLRHYKPIAPSLRMKADKVLVIGVVKANKPRFTEKYTSPSLSNIFGTVLNSVLLDATDLEYRYISRFNHVLSHVPQDEITDTGMKEVDVFMIRPSKDLGTIAQKYWGHLPKIIHYLLRGLGSQKEGSDLVSYLLFEPHFTKELMELGRQDALNQKSGFIQFILNKKSISPMRANL